jgi:hypothetical protein
MIKKDASALHPNLVTTQTLKVLFARDACGKTGFVCKCVPEFFEKNL